MSTQNPRNLDTLGARLQYFLRLVGISQADVSRAANKTPSWITEIVKGRSKCPTELQDILSKDYGLNINWLVTGHGPPRLPGSPPVQPRPAEPQPERRPRVRPSVPKLSDQLQQLADDAAELERDAGLAAPVRPIEIVVSSDVKDHMDALGEYADQFACVPLLADPAGAGPPLEIDERQVESYCVIYRVWLTSPANTLCVRVRGDSMAPILNDGSIVAVNRSRRGPAGLNGKIVAVRDPDEGGVSIRRVVMDGNHLSFTPENPDYDPSTGEPRNRTIILERRPHHGVPAPANPIVGKIDWAWSLFP